MRPTGLQRSRERADPRPPGGGGARHLRAAGAARVHDRRPGAGRRHLQGRLLPVLRQQGGAAARPARRGRDRDAGRDRGGHPGPARPRHRRLGRRRSGRRPQQPAARGPDVSGGDPHARRAARGRAGGAAGARRTAGRPGARGAGRRRHHPRRPARGAPWPAALAGVRGPAPRRDRGGPGGRAGTLAEGRPASSPPAGGAGMSAPPAVRTRGLTHRFGALTALDRVDLEVAPGEVYGFLGRNGAGKTTLIRVLLGLVTPTSGTVDVLGTPVRGGRTPSELWGRIGYLVEGPGLYPSLTVLEHLELAARYRRLPTESVAGVVEQLDLGRYGRVRAAA